MTIKQVAFEIPAVIQAGLDSGTFIRYGGVVRDQGGHIVAHLKEVVLENDNIKEGFQKVLAFAKSHKIILIGTVVTVAAAAGITYIMVKKKDHEEVKVPKCIVDFNKAFMEYMDSIRVNSMSEDKIDKVIISLKRIKQLQTEGSIDIDFSIENANLLLNMVKEYTIKFAQANSFDLGYVAPSTEDKLCDLQYYLSIQKQVFEKSA